MRSPAFVLLLAALLGASAPGKTDADEGLCFELPWFEQWCAGQRAQDANLTLVEAVRGNETLTSWTELLTFVSTRQAVSLEYLDGWIEFCRDQAPERCSRGFSFDIRSTEPLGGQPARIAVWRCRGVTSMDSLHGSAVGRDETVVMLWVLGPSGAAYHVQRTARTAELYDATVDQWVGFLESIRVCEEPSPLPDCD